MISIITAKFSTTIPERIVEGQALSAAEAALLQQLFVNRMRALVAYWMDKKEMSPQEARVNLAAEVEQFSFESKETTVDPVELEATRLARDLINRRLAQEGIELDDDTLDRHVAELAKHPTVTEKAQEIVSIRQKAALEALNKE